MHKCTSAQKHKCTKAEMHKCILYLKKKQTTGAKAGENFIRIQLTNQELSVCVKRAGIKSTCYRTSYREIYCWPWFHAIISKYVSYFRMMSLKAPIWSFLGGRTISSKNSSSPSISPLIMMHHYHH